MMAGGSMRIVVGWVLLILAGRLQAEVVNCPATREGKKLTNAVFYEWLSSSDNRTLEKDRRALMPDGSKVEGEDWFQTWDVTHAVEGNGLQMICQYSGVKAGLFIEIKKVSVCTLTRKSGVVTAGCR
jgi:hypothetical protein